MNRGDVAIVDYPYSDGTGRKVRPVLIVQSDTLNASITDTIVALITSRIHRASDTHFAIDPATPIGHRSGLRLMSVVQCENLFTIDRRFLLRVIGTLEPAAMEEVNECLKRALGL